MALYKKKYHSESARLKGWNYSSDGYYYITICTQNREYFFGDVLNGKMELSKIGKIVKFEWLKTFKMRPDMNLQMDEFIIMPNHFHAIIIIGNNQYNNKQNIHYVAQHRRDAMHCVSTQNGFGPQSKNLSSIIRGFKIGVTRNARKMNPEFAWQPRFHDRIIRNNDELNRIQNYIICNPHYWKKDDKFVY